MTSDETANDEYNDCSFCQIRPSLTNKPYRCNQCKGLLCKKCNDGFLEKCRSKNEHERCGICNKDAKEKDFVEVTFGIDYCSRCQLIELIDKIDVLVTPDNIEMLCIYCSKKEKNPDKKKLSQRLDEISSLVMNLVDNVKLCENSKEMEKSFLPILDKIVDNSLKDFKMFCFKILEDHISKESPELLKMQEEIFQDACLIKHFEEIIKIRETGQLSIKDYKELEYSVDYLHKVQHAIKAIINKKVELSRYFVNFSTELLQKAGNYMKINGVNVIDQSKSLEICKGYEIVITPVIKIPKKKDPTDFPSDDEASDINKNTKSQKDANKSKSNQKQPPAKKVSNVKKPVESDSDNENIND